MSYFEKQIAPEHRDSFFEMLIEIMSMMNDPDFRYCNHTVANKSSSDGKKVTPCSPIDPDAEQFSFGGLVFRQAYHRGVTITALRSLMDTFTLYLEDYFIANYNTAFNPDKDFAHMNMQESVDILSGILDDIDPDWWSKVDDIIEEAKAETQEREETTEDAYEADTVEESPDPEKLARWLATYGQTQL